MKKFTVFGGGYSATMISVSSQVYEYLLYDMYNRFFFPRIQIQIAHVRWVQVGKLMVHLQSYTAGYNFVCYIQNIILCCMLQYHRAYKCLQQYDNVVNI